MVNLRYSFKIDLNITNSISDLLNQIGWLYTLKNKDVVYILIDMPQSIWPEYLVTIIGIIKYIESRGTIVNVKVNNPYNNTYSKRMNFYKELGVEDEEEFKRNSSVGRFVEITKFNKDNSDYNVAIVNDIMKVIKNNYNLDKSVKDCLNYCLFEMVDNIQNHAEAAIDGYTVVQNFSKRQELKIIILDTGKGIHASLTENDKYKNLSPAEALEYCVKESVTNGRGMGNGLFHTSEFIKKNLGEFFIYSGNNYLHINDKGVNIFSCPYWQGTIIYVRIKTNNTVCLESVFGKNIPSTVEDADDYINDLW